jgi:hypothetical protein
MARTKGSKNVLRVSHAHCKQCGKLIEGFTDQWAYQRTMRMAGKSKSANCTFCSWSCLCQAQRDADTYYGNREDKYDAIYRHRRERDRRRY